MSLIPTIERIQNFLKNDLKVDIDFYIAGGYMYAIENNSKKYNDIDVFFYSDKDRDTFLAALRSAKTRLEFNKKYNVIIDTRNAITINENDLDLKEIQFIIMKTGSIQDMLDTFDFNCSKIASTSSAHIIKDQTYSNIIKADLKNFKTNSIDRYVKYRFDKNCTDPDNKTAIDIIKFLVENYDQYITPSYNTEAKTLGVDLLNGFTWSINNTLNITMELIQNTIVTSTNEYTRLKIFDKFFSYHQYYFIDDFEMCDELKVFQILSKYNRLSFSSGNVAIDKVAQAITLATIKYTEDEMRIIMKFPEYFI